MVINIKCDCGNESFVPSYVTADVGQPVVFHNRDAVAHSIFAPDGAFNTGTIAGGGDSGVMTPPFGTHSYTCTAHPGMTGTLIVKPGDGGMGLD